MGWQSFTPKKTAVGRDVPLEIPRNDLVSPGAESEILDFCEELITPLFLERRELIFHVFLQFFFHEQQLSRNLNQTDLFETSSEQKVW